MSLAAEALVAVTGIYPKDPVSPADAAAAAALPKEWSEMVVTFFDATRLARLKRTPQVNYLMTWERLNVHQEDERLIIAIDDADVGAAYKIQLDKARGYLRDAWQPLFQDVPTGRRILPPATSEQQRASALYAVVDKPTRLLGDLAAGALTADILDAFETVCPELYAMLSAIIDEEIKKRVAARKSYEVPWMQERTLRMFWGMAAGQPMKPRPEEPDEQQAAPKIDIDMKSKAELLRTRGQEISGQ